MDKYLPTYYQQYIALSRYARWRDDLGRREYWPETVGRYFKHVADWHASKYEYNKRFFEYLSEAEESVLNLRGMPSMRAMMTAGPALERDHIAGYNCLSGSTKILTREHGLTDIGSLSGKTVSLLDANGEWVPSPVRSFGQSETVCTKWGFNRWHREVQCTMNHNWHLSDGRVVETRDLKDGDTVEMVSPKRSVDKDSIDYKLGVIHGIIYGDGVAVHKCRRSGGYHIRVCSDHAEFSEILAGYPCTFPPSMNGDPVYMFYDGFAKTHELKELPPKSESEDYIIGFVRGWMAADGHVSADGKPVLCCTQAGIDWLDSVASTVGYFHMKPQVLPDKTNYGLRNRDTFNVAFARQCMEEDDFLIERKRLRFKPLSVRFSYRGIKDGSKLIEEVFCPNVSTTHSFALEGGLLTGNCAFVAMDDVRAFDEIMYILMCGTGVGFSVESRYISKLPEVADSFFHTDTTVRVADSKTGWATSFREWICLLYAGKIPKHDVSKIRSKGARLKTFGGRASGPDPLIELFEFCVKVFKGAAGRRLTDIEVHDIVCKVAAIVVVGGVRRSALISISDLGSYAMRTAKSGEWWKFNDQRALANNSAIYYNKPEMGEFLEEWLSLFRSNSGERGIFNKHAINRLDNGRRNFSLVIGANPCLEILLRSMQFCNLTTMVIRSGDTREQIEKKVRVASFLGTVQSAWTDFRYIRKAWKHNCEEERLLGVSMTGIMDHEFLGRISSDERDQFLREMTAVSQAVNIEVAAILGIQPSTAITCIKPEGTVSALADASPGIHTRYFKFGIRRVRADAKDPLTHLMKDAGIPWEPDITKPDSVVVFSFPMKSPEGAKTRHDLTAIDQLKIWLAYKKNWAEHTVSITVYVRDHEWIEVADWVYKNFDDITGISFLPYSDFVYKQAPFEEVTEDEYNRLLAAMPASIDWSRLTEYEKFDTTTSSHEIACGGGQCEIK